jgi:hypothetical protein
LVIVSGVYGNRLSGKKQHTSVEYPEEFFWKFEFWKVRNLDNIIGNSRGSVVCGNFKK